MMSGGTFIRHQRVSSQYLLSSRVTVQECRMQQHHKADKIIYMFKVKFFSKHADFVYNLRILLPRIQVHALIYLAEANVHTPK